MVGLTGLMFTVAFVPEHTSPATTPIAQVEENPVRDTEAEALVAAAALNQPVEVLAHRSEYRDVFAQPDGTLIANDHAQPVRVTRGDAWVPADAALVTQPDGSITPTAALIDMRLSPGGTTPLMVVMRDQQSMTLTWPHGPLPTPVLSGDQAVYPDVLQDVDLVTNVSVEGFSNVLVLKTPEAANLPELQDLRLGVTADGLTVEETEGGGVVALDPATSNPVLEADAPTMWDSGSGEGGTLRSLSTASDPEDASPRGPGDSSAVASVDLEYASGNLTLTPDAGMLDDPETTFPVYIDPVWQSSTNSAWAMVDSGYPSEEYWKFDGKRHERIGRCPSLCDNSQVKRLFYRLATPYAGTTILSAEFRVTMQHAYNSTARAAAVYLMSSGISTATNWSNQPGGASWSGAILQDTKSPTSTQSTCTATNQNVAWNVKAAVDLAVVNRWSTITLGLRAANESDSTHSKRFCDNGLLSVRYNRAPLIANQSELTTSPGGQCVYGSAAPYVDVPPKLVAVLRDPDHSSAHTEKIKAEFRVTWTPAGGTLQSHTLTTGLLSSGSPFTVTAPPGIAQNVPISWEVRASDGTSWGPWSSDGSREVCQFRYDTTNPSAPDVDSVTYLPADTADNGTANASACIEDDDWHGSIGVPGSFTFDSAATDVVEYRYGFNVNPSPTNVLRPATDGGPVTLANWTPTGEGPQRINVQAVDRAGRLSSIASCTFRVGKRPPAAQWSLSDVAGDPVADDQFGGHDATVGSGVTLGVEGPGGASDSAASFDGTANGYLATTTNVLNTSASFAVSGWFKVDDTTRRQTAVSQDGVGEPGFTLGVEAGSWVFRMPVTAVDSLGEWKVTAPGATTGWTYVAASFDAVQKVMSLQVGAAAPVTAQRRSLARSLGPVQLGRRIVKGGYADYWAGDMADISVFDRLVLASEVTGLKKTAPSRKAYWRLNAESGKVSPEHGNGAGMTLGVDATIYQHPALSLLGGGHLALTAKPGSYASTPTSADMAGSFTIAARVKLTSNCAGTPMTVLSQKGTHNSSVIVRCNAAGTWEMAVPGTDTVGATSTAVDTGTRPRTLGKGDHLALVYNGYTREMLLYVNGVPTDAIELITPFTATGGLQLGRAFVDDGYREHLSAAVDDVRVYDGVADTTLVQRLTISIREQPTI
ncbi:LamG domain-containing protein [Micromonospora inyonensis]|nr:LamG domain-containing protein [Micromonospora inyonensis]